MKCRYCEAQARVISTRTPNGEFYVVRRLACTAFPRTHRFNTVEVLESLIAKIPRKRIEEYLGHNRRGAARNRTAHERYTAAVQLINAGEKYDVIADQLGVSLASVRKYASKGLQAGHVTARRGGHGTRIDLPPGPAHVFNHHDDRSVVLGRQRGGRAVGEDLAGGLGG